MNMTAILTALTAAVVSGILFGVIAFFLGIRYRKKVAETELGSAEEEAKRIINDAIKAGEVKQKESLVEAKDEIHRLRTEADRELKERRADVQR